MHARHPTRLFACVPGPQDNLRLYNERLRLKSCMPWSNGVVRQVLV
jgi:hypothetical protein